MLCNCVVDNFVVVVLSSSFDVAPCVLSLRVPGVYDELVRCGANTETRRTDNVTHLFQMLPQIVHILRFCLVDMLPPDFVVNWIRPGLLDGHKSGNPFG